MPKPGKRAAAHGPAVLKSVQRLKSSPGWPVWEVAASPEGRHCVTLLRQGAAEALALAESSLQFERSLHGTYASLASPAGLHFWGPSTCTLCEVERVHTWDLRAGPTDRVTLRAAGEGRKELLACASQGHLVAAGAPGLVYLWDRRRPGEQLACLQEAHDSDVTLAAFHPEREKALVTADEEGNVAAWSLETLGEEEDYVAGLSLGGETPVRGGFYGSRMWFCTATHTFHLWDWEAACQEDAAGGASTLADLAEAPRALAAAAPRGGPSLPVTSLVECCYDGTAGQLWLAASDDQGQTGLWPVEEPAGARGEVSFGAPTVFSGAHEQEVHCLRLLPNRRAVTGSEDGTVVLWRSEGSPSPQKKPKRR